MARCSSDRTSARPSSDAIMASILARSSPARRRRRPGRRIANVAPFVEVGGEQPLDDDVLLALLTGEQDQPMGVDGVRGALYLVMVEHEPLRPPCRGDLRVERLGMLPSAELGGAVGAPVDSALGISGLSSKGRHVTDAMTSGAIAAIALSSRRLAIEHQGQIASEITSMASVALAPDAGLK